mmetsp:Transcript_24776/g.77681  ORF Transcript_24776/g.77681 Transcript_24776/m.77681 type:complete len:344 (-) Transcript_24776:82-1113(-)
MVGVVHAEVSLSRELVDAGDEPGLLVHLVVLVGIVLAGHRVEVADEHERIGPRVCGAIHASLALLQQCMHLHSLDVGEARIPVQVCVAHQDTVVALDAAELAEHGDVALARRLEPEMVTVRGESFPDHEVNVDAGVCPAERRRLAEGRRILQAHSGRVLGPEVLAEQPRDGKRRPPMQVQLVRPVDGRAAVEAAARLLEVHAVELPLLLQAAEDVVKGHLLHLLQAVDVRLEVKQLRDDELAPALPVERLRGGVGELLGVGEPVSEDVPGDHRELEGPRRRLHAPPPQRARHARRAHAHRRLLHRRRHSAESVGAGSGGRSGAAALRAPRTLGRRHGDGFCRG